MESKRIYSFETIHHATVEDVWDFPKCCDAWVSEAWWKDGERLTHEELDILNSDNSLVSEFAWKQEMG
jgi:hypothetical protein